jgi:hypothetical protein
VVSRSDDELVTDYLRRLNAAAAVLPDDRRHELVEEIAVHIAEARAAIPAQPGGVRTILEQLGQPEEIVAAAGGRPAVGQSGSRPGAQEIIAVILLLIGGVVVPLIGWVAGVVLLWSSRHWSVRDKLLGTLVWPFGLAGPLVLIGAGLVVNTSTTRQGCAVSATPSGSGGQIIATGTAHCAAASASAGLPAALGVALLLIVTIAGIAAPVLVAIRLLRSQPEQYVRPGPELVFQS